MFSIEEEGEEEEGEEEGEEEEGEEEEGEEQEEHKAMEKQKEIDSRVRSTKASLLMKQIKNIDLLFAKEISTNTQVSMALVGRVASESLLLAEL